VFLSVSALPIDIRGGRSMPFAQVRAMLSRPVYVARPDHGDPDVLARPVGRWPQLVPDHLYRRVQEQIAKHAYLPRQATGSYLLTGMIVCPRCGGRVNGDLYRGQYRYYRCAGHCNAPQLGLDMRCTWAAPCLTIDAAALVEVGELLGRVSTDSDELRLAWNELVQPTDLAKVRAQRVAALERVAAKQRQRLKDAALKLVDGEIDKAGYELARDAATEALTAADEEIKRLSAAPAREFPDLEVVIANLPSWKGALEEADIPIQRGVLRPLIERVVPVRVARGKYAVEITWTRLGEMLREIRGLTESRSVSRATTGCARVRSSPRYAG
jgi:hypothetical protein